MTPTRNFLKNPSRPVHVVEMPGGGTVHVRDLTIRELRRVDELAAEQPEGEARAVRGVLLLCAAALAEPDGTALFPDPAAGEALDAVEGLATSQLEAITAAAMPTKTTAKNA
jgi:hypothetical protein